MRLTLCLESDTEGQVLASVDMEEILKQYKDDSISKEVFEKMKSKSYQYGYRKGHGEAINKVLELPKYTIYDTSNEFMNIRIDAISIDDILKLKETKQWQMKTIQT